MNKSRFLIVVILIFILLMSSVACGSNNSDSSDEPSTVNDVAEPIVAPPVDPNATDEELIATWQDINVEDRISVITKEGDEYKYEGKYGTYMGNFNEGKIVFKVNETETTDVYIDKATGHMVLVYQDTVTEFKKK